MIDTPLNLLITRITVIGIEENKEGGTTTVTDPEALVEAGAEAIARVGNETEVHNTEACHAEMSYSKD